MDAIETIQYKTHTIKIFPDSYDDSPRSWDNIAEIHCSHKRYSLGDKNFNYKNGSDCIEAAQNAQKNGDIVLPLFMYDHSSITISLSPFSCPWDSGQVGFVIVRKEKMLKEFSAKKFSKFLKNKALKIAEGEVETYDQYLRGEVYGYKIDEDDTCSCWGFYGMDECVEEAKGVVDWMVKQDIKKHCEQVKKWIMNKVPLVYRTLTC